MPDADDGTWAKIRFDADWTTMAELLPTIERPATRVVVVNAFRDAVRNAEVDPGLALEALLATAAVDEEDVVVGSVLRFCSEVLAASFTAVDRRPERLARVHDTARAVTEHAGEGSDRQLLGFRYAIASCAHPELLRRGWTVATCHLGCRSTPSWSGRWWCGWPRSAATWTPSIVPWNATRRPPVGCTRPGLGPRCRTRRRRRRRGRP